jgi:2-polyprenyl-3-methyl-5-hydroxy-6-metoxy-1,4-benzoquinol methylase
MIQRHWSLERQLTARLLQSRSEERTGVFEDCYGQLYRELGWLNAMIETARPASVKTRLQETWASWIGAPPLRVYEIGAGKGELSAYLAGNGYTCRAAEVTAERGAKWVGRDVKGLTWGTTDGVDLARYETAGSFDVVISDQVVEHLRPEDLVRHMEGARMLLKPGGRYIVRTPHRFCGPWDVSRVFKRPFACGMHLKEYTYAELHKALAEGGFCRIGVAAAGRPEGSRRRLCLYECVEQIVKRLAFQELRGRLMALAERGSWMDSQIAMVGNTKAACR